MYVLHPELYSRSTGILSALYLLCQRVPKLYFKFTLLYLLSSDFHCSVFILRRHFHMAYIYVFHMVYTLLDIFLNAFQILHSYILSIFCNKIYLVLCSVSHPTVTRITEYMHMR